MKLQVLAAVINQNNHDILNDMRIESDAIIINQCDRNLFEEFSYKGNKIKFLSFNEKGVGLSRNNALMRATADICVFADEDEEFEEGYAGVIIDEFQENPKADIILFNLRSGNSLRELPHNKRFKRLRYFNCLKYGAVQMAVRLESIRMAGVTFSLLFGGGAYYGAGEDSLFIAESIRKKLRVYASSKFIGFVKQEASSWYNGYTEKYFIDKGAFYSVLSPTFSYFLSLYFAAKHWKKYKKEQSFLNAMCLMSKGRKSIGGHIVK